MSVLTETRAQDSAPLALTSVWLKVQEFLIGLKKSFLGGRGEKGRHKSSAVPAPNSPLFAYNFKFCAHLQPIPVLRTKNRQQKQPEERFQDYFVFLHLDGDVNAALGSIILGGYVYRVKYILPNQETE